jgi:hypothetical protein
MADDSVGAVEPPGSVVIPAMPDEREIPSQPVRLDYPPSGTTATPDDLSSPAIDLPEHSAEGAIIRDAPPRQDRSRLASKGQDRPAPPLDIDTEDQLLRLQYLCRLIRVARHPYCGMNGMLTVLPYEISQATKTALSSLAQSIRKDIQVAQSTLQLRAPVSSVIVGLDRDDGFAELVRRLPAEYQGRRLGGRFDLTAEPTPDALNRHSDRLCDAFEDWIYMLFREPSAVQEHRGNRKLFRLLNRIRHELKPQLRLLIGGAFGPNADQTGREDPVFFSGCYFASIGMYGGPVAFIRGVLSDKLIREQAKVQWNGRARRWQAILRIVGAVGWLLLILAVLALAAQLASPTLRI